MWSAKRIKTLVYMQLPNRKKFRHMKSKLSVVTYVLLRVLLIALITLICAGVIYICQEILAIKIDRNFLLFFITITQVIALIGHTNGLSNLYLSKDNAILLQFPVRHNEIFISKMIVQYVNEFIRDLFFIFPILIAFGIIGDTPVDVGYWFNIILLIFILPLIPLFLGAIFSIPLMFVKRLFKAIPWLQTALGIIVLGGIIWLVVFLVGMIPNPLRIFANYLSFADGLNNFIIDVNSYLYVYQNIINTLFATRLFTDYLIMFGVAIGLIIVAFLLALPLFFKIVTQFSEFSIVRKHKKTKNKPKSIFYTYFTKEIVTIIRTPGRLISLIVNIVAFPLVIFVVNSFFNAISTSSIGNSMIIGFNILIGLIMLTANNSNAAASISNEGAEFAVLKTAPSKTYKIVWSEISVYLIVNAVTIALGFMVLGIVTDIKGLELLWLFFVFMLISSAHLLWAVQFDILEPHLSEVALKGSAYNNPNVGKSILAGLLVAVGFCCFTIFFMVDAYFAGWTKLILAGIAFFVLRLILFMANLKVYYKRIEF